MIIERIVVAVDFSRNSESALREAMHLAAATGAELIAVHAHERPAAPAGPMAAVFPGEMIMVHSTDSTATRLARQLSSLESRLRELTSGCEAKVTVIVREGEPDDLIPEIARSHDANLIVIGTHGRTGFKRLRLGSVAERVVRHGDCSVLVIREGAEPAEHYRKILVATDFSDHAGRALEAALSVAAPETIIEVLHVWMMPTGDRFAFASPEGTEAQLTHFSEEIQKTGHQWLENHRNRGPKLEFAEICDSPASGIHRHLEAGGHDLVVLGSRGHRGLKRWLLGSVAEATVRHAACSVLVVHG